MRLDLGDEVTTRLQAADDEVSNDAIQLIAVSTYNGLCRTIAALGRSHVLTAEQLADIHEAMAVPLDDPQMRDDELVTCVRETLEDDLAHTLMCLRAGLREDPL